MYIYACTPTYMCQCASMHEHIHTCMAIYMYLHIHVYRHVYMSVSTCMHVCAYTNPCIYTCTCIFICTTHVYTMYACFQVCMYVCMYLYVCQFSVRNLFGMESTSQSDLIHFYTNRNTRLGLGTQPLP